MYDVKYSILQIVWCVPGKPMIRGFSGPFFFFAEFLLSFFYMKKQMTASARCLTDGDKTPVNFAVGMIEVG